MSDGGGNGGQCSRDTQSSGYADLDRAGLLRQVETMSEALETRTMIGYAVGIFMVAHRLDRDRAFDALRRHSNRTNARVVRIANKIVEQHEQSLSQ